MFTNKFRVSLDYIILEYLFLLGMFSGFLEHIRIWRIGIFGLLLLLPIYSRKYAKTIFRDRVTIFMFASMFILILLSITHSSKNEYTLHNLSLLLSSTAVAVMILYISQGGERVFSTFLKNKFWIINIWMGINIVVTLVQVTGYPLMIRSRWIAENAYYPDLCCGLFGGARTNTLALYSCFVVIYNLLYSNNITGMKKITIKVWSFIVATLQLYISTQNDNIALFLLLPLNLFFYCFCYREKQLKLTEKVKKILKILALLFLVFVLLYQIPIIKEFFNEIVINRVEKLLFYNKLGVYGSNQRLAIAQYALDRGWGWTMGLGIGVSKWRELYAFGFVNYGLSSIGTVINLMGIWFYILMVILYAYSCFRASNGKLIGKSITMIITIICTILISIYTELFTTEVFTYWFVMWFAVYRMNGEVGKRDNTVTNIKTIRLS